MSEWFSLEEQKVRARLKHLFLYKYDLRPSEAEQCAEAAFDAAISFAAAISRADPKRAQIEEAAK